MLNSDIATKTLPQLPEEGLVLGVDVGFSPKNRSTGFCSLRWDRSTAVLEFCRTTSDPKERETAIESLVRSSELLAVALDGPLTKELRLVNTYRAAEALLSGGILQKRGKPGPTSAPIGQKLHGHATDLAKLVATIARIAPATHTDAIHPLRVIEAFPSMYLAALVHEAQIPFMKRNKTDAYWNVLTVPCDTLSRHTITLLPGRTLRHNLVEISNHDDRAAFVCSLTALAVLQDRYLAVGDPVDGGIFLPHQNDWGSGLSSENWFGDVLRTNLRSIVQRKSLPKARVRTASGIWSVN